MSANTVNALILKRFSQICFKLGEDIVDSIPCICQGCIKGLVVQQSFSCCCSKILSYEQVVPITVFMFFLSQFRYDWFTHIQMLTKWFAKFCPCQNSYCGVAYAKFSSNYIISNDSVQTVIIEVKKNNLSWWRHQMETLSAFLALCAGNSPVTGEFLSQRQVTRSFDVFFDLHPIKRFSKQSWTWLFEMPWCPLWRYCNVKWDKVPHSLHQHIDVAFIIRKQCVIFCCSCWVRFGTY